MRRHRAFASSVLALSLCACEIVDAVSAPPPGDVDPWSDASAGLTDPALAKLAAEFWQAELAWDPLQATYLGDPRYHGELLVLSPRRKGLRRSELEGFRHGASLIEPAALSDSERTTWELLSQEIEKRLTRLDLALEEWNVDPVEGPHTSFLNVALVQPRATPREREQVVSRWKAMGAALHQVVRNLEHGRAFGKIASHTAIAKTIEQLDGILAVPPMESPFVTIATGGGTWVDLPNGKTVAEIAHEYLDDARRTRELRMVNRHLQDGERLAVGTRVLVPAVDDPLTPEERGEFLHEVLTTTEFEIYPALAFYHDFLRDTLLPNARSDDKPGIQFLPGGAAAYLELVHDHTSLPRAECDPRAIHQFGLDEVARIQGEISLLGQRVFGSGEIVEIQRRLRSDPGMHFASREEVEGKAAEALYRARAAMPRYFGRLPLADCVVVPIPLHEERDTTIAYYRQPTADGSEPGKYFVNTFAPQTRPRYEAEVLAYHESIPGHHLQVAIASELTELPRFQRHGGWTAFVEGWALYVERLSDEMGLYSSDVDRLGVLSFDAWRASRLVVDTGIHALGWTRDQAIDYLSKNTLLAENNVENEVDRYIAWPAQALAYKIGQREILKLRDEARAQLGPRFSYPGFHDQVLGHGAVSLSTLRKILEHWIAANGNR